MPFNTLPRAAATKPPRPPLPNTTDWRGNRSVANRRTLRAAGFVTGADNSFGR
jgi:hypothetical protein